MPTPDRPDLLQQTLSGVINLNDSAAAALRAGGASAMLALLRQTLKDDRDGMKALERMGDTFLRVGAPDDAAECYREGLAMAGRTGDQERTCRFHLALGSALDEAGRAPAALDIYRSGKSIAESLGLRGLEARFLNNLGILTQKGNEPLKAIPYYQKSLELKEAEKDLKGAISTRLNLASLLAAHGRWADLAPQIEKILAAAKEAKDERAEAYGQLLKGQSFGAAGEWQFAIGPLSIALGLFQRVADGEGELTATMSTAESAIELRDGGHAYVLLKSAQEMAERRKDGPRTARILTLFNRLDHLFAAPGQEHTTTPIEEVTRERNGLLRLQEIAKALNQEHELQKLLERILDSAISLTNAERGILLLKEGEELSVRVARNYTGVAAAEGGEAAAGGAPRPTGAPGDSGDVRVSRSIAESVARRGVPVISTSAVQDKEWSSQRSVANLNLRATLCVAVRERERILGVVYLDDRRRDHAFGLVDLRLLEALADQAALALAAQGRAIAATVPGAGIPVAARPAAPPLVSAGPPTEAGAPWPFAHLTLAEVERMHVRAVLRETAGDLGVAALRLGISPENLAERKRRLGL